VALTVSLPLVWPATAVMYIWAPRKIALAKSPRI
jgi:hypothetical protein